MRVLSDPPIVVAVEMNIIELRAIMKIIGITSHARRKDEFNLSEEESLAASDVHTVIYHLFRDEL